VQSVNHFNRPSGKNLWTRSADSCIKGEILVEESTPEL
jgi:hypothetical protein